MLRILFLILFLSGLVGFSVVLEYRASNEMIRSVKRKYNNLEGITVNTAPAGNLVTLTHRAASAVSVLKTTYTLSDDLNAALINMEEQREIAENIWAIDVDNAFVAYENAVAAFNEEVSPNEQIDVYDLIKPHVESLYPCQGPCYVTFETLSAAMYSHSRTCYEKHGASGSGKSYWSCEYNVCPSSNNHWLECRASHCSVLFPPPEHEHEWDSYDHKVKCTESVYNFWNPNAKCGEEYYTCEHPTCPKSNTHWSPGSSNPPSAGGGTPPSPSYHECGICETSVGGDHSLQASCSLTDENGQSCTVTGFYACQSHTCVFPDPPSPDPPSDNTPGCSYCTYGCSVCQVPCYSCYGYYDSNDPDAVAWHSSGKCAPN